MKKALGVLTVLSMGSILLISACKKEGTTIPPDVIDITGTWSGTYVDNLTKGTLTFVLSQEKATVTGTFTAVDSAKNTGNGAVNGNVLNMKDFALRATGASGSCSMVDILSGSVSNNKIGDSLMATYTGTNTCGGSWSGSLRLIKQQ